MNDPTALNICPVKIRKVKQYIQKPPSKWYN